MKRKGAPEKIYEASARLFQEKGYDAVKIDDICSAVGISKPTLYASKLTKRDLLIHAYKPKRAETFIEQSVCDLNNMEQEIFRSVDLVAERLFVYGPDLLRDLLKLHLSSPAFEEVMDEEWIERLTTLIRVSQQKKQVKNLSSPVRLANIIATSIIGYSFQYAMNQAEESRKNLHDSVHIILQTEIPNASPLESRV